MDRTIFYNRFRNVFILASISLLGVVFAFVIDNYRSTNLEDDTALDSYLAQEYKLILDAVKNIHPNEIDLNSLLESPYDLWISQNDSLIFWNNYITALGNRVTSSDDYAIMYKDIQNMYNVSIGLDLTKDGKLDKLLQYKGFIDFNRASRSQINSEVIDYKGRKFNLSGQIIEQVNYALQIGFVFYLLFLIALMAGVYHAIFIRKILPIWISIGVAAGVLVFHYLIGDQLFHNTITSNIKNDYSTICPNIQSLGVLLLVALFLINVIKRSRAITKIKSEIVDVIGPFLTASGFVLFCHFANGLLHSEPLQEYFVDVFQYTQEGFLYVLGMLALLVSIFYGSIVVFNQSKSNTNQLVKYTCWIGGILLSVPLAIYLDIKIPLWTIYTFVLSFLLILDLYLENTETNIIYIIWWIIILSGFLASITFYYRLDSNMKVGAEKIAKLYTHATEEDTQDVQAIDSILKASDVFPQLASLKYPSGLVKSDFQDYVFSIIEDQSGQFSSSDFSLEATDQEGLTIFNNHYSTAYSFSQSIAKSKKLSDHIYYNPFDSDYYLKYNIENEAYNDAPFNLYLRLKTDNEVPDISNTNYVIFKKNAVVSSSLINNTEFNIRNLLAIDESKIEGDITYSLYEPDDSVKIVAFDQIGGLIKPISLFSFIVSICGILLFFISLVNTKYNILPAELDIQFARTSSLRTKIQMAIIMLIIFSFLIIGIMTSFYFKSVLEEYNNNDQKEDITSIRNDIRNSIDGVDNNFLASSTVQSKIAEMSHVHDKNLAFFDDQGELLTSSFVSPRVSHVPYGIVRGFSTPGSVNPQNRIRLDGSYNTIEFIPVFYKSQQNPYGYLGISYDPVNNSSRSIRDFLSTILNVYVFLFLIAGALAIAIGNSITKPLAILSNKLKDFKLGKTNQALDWHTKDEIGNLINEYNMLTEKLDESVSILARTERDVAWREMAKQVAHEIKNPLTPMKLSIQYLERAVKENPDNARDMIGRVSTTLIEQINNLNQIANEFSNFATMPKATNEKIVINEIVEAIHDLFRKREDMEVNMTEPIDDLFVFADRNHLVRILNNIVKNAIQAIPTDKKGVIDISLTKVGAKAVVAVKDNGSGIPDHMKEKVFTPNFTTKSSGTGLGLAISANMIESFNGRIYFETKVNVGTEFFVEIPLMRLQDNFPENQKRVSLD